MTTKEKKEFYALYKKLKDELINGKINKFNPPTIFVPEMVYKKMQEMVKQGIKPKTVYPFEWYNIIKSKL